MSGEDQTPPVYAYVRYAKRYRDWEIVKIKKVSTQTYAEDMKSYTRDRFKPKSKEAFCKTTWYVVKSSKGTKSGNEENFWAQIGVLGHTVEEIEAAISKKGAGARVAFPAIPDPETEPDETADEDDSHPTNTPVQAQRALRLQIAKNRKKSTGQSMNEYLQHTALDDAELEGEDEGLGPATKRMRGDADSSFSSETPSLESVQSSIHSLLGLMKGFQEDLSQLKTTVAASTSKLEEKVSKLGTDVNDMANKLSKCESKAGFIQDWLNNLSQESGIEQ